ncbi:MAG: hypothetical protein ACTSXQ_07000 [Alphaproteobacteria bacterium]
MASSYEVGGAQASKKDGADLNAIEDAKAFFTEAKPALRAIATIISAETADIYNVAIEKGYIGGKDSEHFTASQGWTTSLNGYENTAGVQTGSFGLVMSCFTNVDNPNELSTNGNPRGFWNCEGKWADDKAAVEQFQKGIVNIYANLLTEANNDAEFGKYVAAYMKEPTEISGYELRTFSNMAREQLFESLREKANIAEGEEFHPDKWTELNKAEQAFCVAYQEEIQEIDRKLFNGTGLAKKGYSIQDVKDMNISDQSLIKYISTSLQEKGINNKETYLDKKLISDYFKKFPGKMDELKSSPHIKKIKFNKDGKLEIEYKDGEKTAGKRAIYEAIYNDVEDGTFKSNQSTGQIEINPQDNQTYSGSFQSWAGNTESTSSTTAELTPAQRALLNNITRDS